MRERLLRRDFLKRSGLLTSAGALTGAMANRGAAEESKNDERQFELGTITYNIGRDWDLDTLIEKCEKLDLRAVELRSTHKHGVEPDISSQRRSEVRKRFAGTPVKLFGLGSACEFHSPDSEVVKRNIELTGRFAQLAHDLGATGVKVRPNGLATKQGIPEETTLKQIGHALRECGQAAEPLGVEIWVEVHGRETSDPFRMKRIMDHCGHPSVGVTWNSNPTDLKDGSIDETFPLLAPHIRCVHINEMWKPYPYRDLFTKLRRMGYARYTMAEIPGNPDPDRLMRYYRKLWNELSRPA